MADEPAVDDFASTAVDREAVSFDEPAPATAAPAAPPERGGEPDWAGTLPRANAVAVPIPATPEPVAPAPAPAAPAPAAPEPVDPMELAETSHRQGAVKLSEEPPLNQLEEDRRIAAEGRAAGWKPGSKTPDAEDKALRVGLWVVVGLVALLVLGLCGGLGWTLLEEPEAAGAVDE